MTTTDNISAIEAIEKAMEGATPGPWREGTEGNQRVYGPDGMGEHSGLIANIFKGRANTRYIAACSPERISAILAEARKAGKLKREIAEKDARIAALEGGLRVLAEKYTTITPPREEIFDGARHPDDMADDELALTVFEIGDIRRARTLLNGGSDAQE